MSLIEVKVPDIGAEGVDVIEVMIKPGDKIAKVRRSSRWNRTRRPWKCRPKWRAPSRK